MINIMYYFICNIITQLSVEKINNSFFKFKNSYINKNTHKNKNNNEKTKIKHLLISNYLTIIL